LDGEEEDWPEGDDREEVMTPKSVHGMISCPVCGISLS
jgi:hypothetical protein